MAKRGGFPGGMPGGMPGNMNNIMKQAQKMQKQMEEAQEMCIRDRPYLMCYDNNWCETKGGSSYEEKLESDVFHIYFGCYHGIDQRMRFIHKNQRRACRFEMVYGTDL